MGIEPMTSSPACYLLNHLAKEVLFCTHLSHSFIGLGLRGVSPPDLVCPPFVFGDNVFHMFVVSGHLYRPLPSSQPCGLKVKIQDGFGTRPPRFLGAGLSILVFF